MAKKTATVSETATPVRTAKPRASKPAAPRVSSAKHSKSPVPVVPENRHEAISKIAYGYWIARGCKGGAPHEDWLRAEREYLARQ